MDPILGTVILSAFPFAPQGWMFCNGQLLNIRQYTALYSLLGTAYGGDGVNTFALPDLAGRIPVALNGTAAPDRIVTAAVATPGGNGTPKMGDKLAANVRLSSTGTASVALQETNLPSHTHAATASSTPASVTMKITASLDAGSGVTPMANGYLAVSKANGASVSSIYTTAIGPAGSVELAGGTGQVSVTPTITNSNTGNGTPLQAPVTVTAAAAPTPPFLAMQYIIAVEGNYPMRN